MHEVSGKHILIQLKNKWKYQALFSQLFLSLALSSMLSMLLYKLFASPLYVALPLFIASFTIILLINKSWNLSELDVSSFLNAVNPLLEESTQLTLKPTSSLNFLEKLQVRKIEKVLVAIDVHNPFKRRFTISLFILLFAFLASYGLYKIPFKTNLANTNDRSLLSSTLSATPEKRPAEIKNIHVVITPPAYTGNSVRLQNRFNLLAEEGATVAWQLQTNMAVTEVSLVFNDGSILKLAGDNEHKSWNTQKLIKASGFYQVKINSKLSDLYKIEAVKDRAPTVSIQSPKPSTYINYGQPERLQLNTTLADDYGIVAASISATISSGSGEGVNFKEQKLSFANFAPGRRDYRLQKTIDCKALGMKPGDELYFFISTTDNHKQEARSEVYIVTLQDTTDMMSLEGVVMSLDVKPDLFRSQRQIIIETEQLLKDRATITAEAFKKKSDELGVDQKLLRMRYGKFLGEETNVEIGGEQHHEEEHADDDNANSADQLMEQFTHKHDNAEDASFFDPATKKQLKATLNEMWNAELKLRTFLPKEALPYEYKALLLLKDLQQKSRAYVPKTGFKTTPLKLDKRLSGDLSKIAQPISKESFQNPGNSIVVRQAMGSLEQLKASGNLKESSKEILQQAYQQLSVWAANQPAAYLVSLSSLRKILNDDYRIKDINHAERGLQKMTEVAEKLPSSGTQPNMELSKHYFMNLTKSGRQ